MALGNGQRTGTSRGPAGAVVVTAVILYLVHSLGLSFGVGLLVGVTLAVLFGLVVRHVRS